MAQMIQPKQGVDIFLFIGSFLHTQKMSDLKQFSYCLKATTVTVDDTVEI